MMNRECDVLIIGTGLSGLYSALILAQKNLEIALVSKENLEVSNSSLAQGGIAGVMDKVHDNFEKHIQDTIAAGDNLNNLESVRFFIEQAPETILNLAKQGVKFSEKKQGDFDLGREGGHSERRVVHAGDITGEEVINALKKAVLRKRNINILEHHTAIDLITTRKFLLAEENRAVGAYLLNEEGHIFAMQSKAVLLATGGCGKVYLYTSNQDVASGDGLAMAFRAGVPAVNMEMVQFHPTLLYNEKVRSFLISEALRGEGGVLKTMSGNPFMDQYHPLKSLAPRDVVARAIDFELKKSGDDFVYLDMAQLDSDFVVARFPKIYQHCIDAGIDMRKDPIPVVPAAHYSCGGIEASPEGKTRLEGLYVAGEVAHTGLHGANRLASNSLLEAAVMARTSAKEILTYLKHSKKERQHIPPWNDHGVTDSYEQVIVSQNWDEIRRFMWNYVGIVRSNKRLERAMKRIELIKHEINEYYWNFKITRNLLELRNITLVAEIIIRSATKRKESRGLHFNVDYPDKSRDSKDVYVYPEEISD